MLEITMIAILIKLLAISKDPNSVLGCSSNSTILFKLLSCFVLSILISLCVSEKKATSAPLSIKEQKINPISKKMNNEVLCTVIKAKTLIRIIIV